MLCERSLFFVRDIFAKALRDDVLDFPDDESGLPDDVPGLPNAVFGYLMMISLIFKHLLLKVIRRQVSKPFR